MSRLGHGNTGNVWSQTTISVKGWYSKARELTAVKQKQDQQREESLWPLRKISQDVCSVIHVCGQLLRKWVNSCRVLMTGCSNYSDHTCIQNKYIVHMIRIKLHVSGNQTYRTLSNCENRNYTICRRKLGNKTLWSWKSKNTWQLSVRPQIIWHKLDLHSSLSRRRSDVFWFLPLHLVRHLIRDRLSHCSHLFSRQHWKAFNIVCQFLLFLL